MSDESVEVPDPLLEKFEELERAVRQREFRERQERCTHPTCVKQRTFSGRSWEYCTFCHKQFPSE